VDEDVKEALGVTKGSLYGWLGLGIFWIGAIGSFLLLTSAFPRNPHTIYPPLIFAHLGVLVMFEAVREHNKKVWQIEVSGKITKSTDTLMLVLHLIPLVTLDAFLITTALLTLI